MVSPNARPLRGRLDLCDLVSGLQGEDPGIPLKLVLGNALFDETFREWHQWGTQPEGPRVFLNMPQTIEKNEPHKPIRLLVYATPNGNTIEQTLGCKTYQGRDWHFDIQHVMAQTRTYREFNQKENIVLAVVQAPKLSWPSFRSTHPQANHWIAQWLDALKEFMDADHVTLTGHSGGGSFIFGAIEGNMAIPTYIDRIVFLDANYSFEALDHAAKLKDWLRHDAQHRLGVIAYDDREITFNGKKVVSDTGGTYRATDRMVKAWEVDQPLPKSTFELFSVWGEPRNQIRFWVHPNPENKILHTALVGEMNGLLQGLTFDTELENIWGKFGGPRAYSRYVGETPFQEPAPEHASIHQGIVPPEIQQLHCPARDPNAVTGSAFVNQWRDAPRDSLQQQILKELLEGNIPDRLRNLVPIKTHYVDPERNRHECIFLVTRDYLMIGSNEDSIRMPMTPSTACAVAKAWGCNLITRKVSDELWHAADVKLAPQPLTKDRDALQTFALHHAMIDEQLGAKRDFELIVGIKKDVVLTPRLKERANRVAIYGWHQKDGQPIQPLYVGHVDWYVDYSHGIRLMTNQVSVDGVWRTSESLLNDPQLCSLLSDEGPMSATYPSP